MPAPETLSTRRFVKHFGSIHSQLPNRSFCFVLGAGTSVTCGIPAAPTLVDQWLGELYRVENPSVREPTPAAVEAWATAASLNIAKFEYARRAEFYPQVYDARFRLDRDEGYAFVESVIEKKPPKFGYAVLAQILSRTRHRVVVTTNFDNLVADAMAMYTRTYPLVCGHESLARYAHPRRLRRPLVCKIHRDWLLDPHSDPKYVSQLAAEWAVALKALFQMYTPVVIGYAGNDGSLMTFLEELEPDPHGGGMFWCYRDRTPPTERISTLVDRHGGRFVRILGFDELLAQLHSELELPLLHEEIEAQGKTLAREYHEHYKELVARIDAPPAAGETAEATADKRQTRAALEASAKTLPKKSWWAWQLEANAEKDPEKADAVYRAGLKELPDSAELTGNHALFLQNVRKDHDAAERQYQKALALDPNDAVNAGNYAAFLYEVRKDHDAAEAQYQKALALDPAHAGNAGNYAAFLYEVRKKHDQAEELYQKAVDLDPTNAINAGNYAVFLWLIRKDYDAAERLYKKALELDPDNANHIGNCAVFLQEIRKDHDTAERLYKRALELDPANAVNIENYACLCLEIHRWSEALALADRAWGLDKQRGQTSADVAVYRGLIARTHALPDDGALGRLHTLFRQGYRRSAWPFDGALAAAWQYLSPDDLDLYRAVGDAAVDESKVAALGKFPRWAATKPVPLDEPWPVEQLPPAPVPPRGPGAPPEQNGPPAPAAPVRRAKKKKA